MEEPRVEEILVTFSPDDIYRVDETRVLKITMSDCILAFKNGCL
jgi:hypothetical protein